MFFLNNYKNVIIKIILPILFTVQMFSQEKGIIKTGDSFKVIWVKQFPSEKNKSKKTAALWFSDLIFGKKNNYKVTKPIDVIAVNTKSFYVLDQANGIVFEINNNNSHIPKIFTKTERFFSSMVNICSLSNNEYLFTDSRLGEIFKFNISKNTIYPFNDKLKLKQPTGIAYSQISNTIWVVETSQHRITILSQDGEIIKTIGKRGTGKGEFNYPTAIWIDKQGRVYVIDSMNFRIQVFNKNGEVISVFGEQGNASGYFSRPKGIATDSKGHIYISDALFHTIQIFDIKGNFLYNFGKQGRNEGEFWMPAGIYIDENDYIYVADSYNSRVQIFQLVKK
ncbi:MAG: 6-bladed beta-propeller [Flavobacteriaceae bacterium]|nr:6-bladed beta-propeller [Flavobacteriaceae bacterium]